MNWLTHDFLTRTGGWEFDRSHGAGTSSPSHWQQVEEQAPKPEGWMMCFLLMNFVPVQKLCVNTHTHIYIYICSSIWVLFSLPIVTGMLVTFGTCFNQHFDTRYLVFYNPSPPRMFLSLDLLSEYRIQHGTIGPLYVTSSFSTWIFCRGVSCFATACPCDVWCRGLTTCLLHVGPPFGNRFLNTSWAVGLTYWIVYLHFFVFWHMQLYMSWYITPFLASSLLLKYSLFFTSPPVLTSSIDVVFVLSTRKNKSLFDMAETLTTTNSLICKKPDLFYGQILLSARVPHQLHYNYKVLSCYGNRVS